MSLKLGVGASRGPASLLPGAATRHRSAGPCLLACAGGLVSTSAGVAGVKMRRVGGPEKLSKESYAMALGEQIASRKLQQVPSDVQALPLLAADAAPPLQRIMGQRHGGPMAPSRKDSYASALRAQIEARLVQRAEEKTQAFASAPQEGFFGRGGVEAPILGSKRRHGAPPLPTKESYAMALHEQMKMRSIQQAVEASSLQAEVPENDEEAPDELFGKGRRHIAPTALPKNLYAEELLQQMAARKARLAADAELSLGGVAAADVVFSDQSAKVRGKRQVSSEAVSKSSYHTDLQDQMAERAAHRAANAFHKQAPSVGAALFGEEDNAKGGRRKCDLPATSKQSYALFLQEQIAERKAQQGIPKIPGQSCFVGGEAADMGPVRGRRHAGQMAPTSKQEYGLFLQRQMAERECEQAASKFYNQVPARIDNSAFEDGAGHDAGIQEDALDCLLGANAGHAAYAY